MKNNDSILDYESDLINMGGWIHMSDSRPATDEEIANHLLKRQQQMDALNLIIAQEEEEHNLSKKSFEEAWGAKVSEYFNNFEVEVLDMDDLVYKLSTNMFDISPEHFWKDGVGNFKGINDYLAGQAGLDEAFGGKGMREFLEIHKIFGDVVFKRALKGFVDGNHDT
jgi:hypothetical protein